jgi:hypothetical protein
MATIAVWGDPSTESSNIAGTALNSLATGSLSAILADVDNSVNKHFNIAFWIKLGSITPSSGGSITIRLICKRGSTYTDRNATIFTGEFQTVGLTTTTSAKEISTCTMRIPGPGIYGIEIVNNSGVTLASSGNEVYYRTWPEEIKNA